MLQRLHKRLDPAVVSSERGGRCVADPVQRVCQAESDGRRQQKNTGPKHNVLLAEHGSQFERLR
jgi:hypothetical protein